MIVGRKGRVSGIEKRIISSIYNFLYITEWISATKDFLDFHLNNEWFCFLCIVNLEVFILKRTTG